MIIIYAHPSREGHCGAILNEITNALKQKGVKGEVWDLYKMNFDPVLHLNEHESSEQKEISQENLKLQEKIKSEEKFIFIYPVWWNNMPAILKGFIDRVFTLNFAYKFENNKGVGLLKGQAAVFTTSGAPRLVMKWLEGDRALKLMCKDTLKFCGINAKGFSLGGASAFDEEKREEIKQLVAKGLTWLQV